jgi:hypothetical protein
LPNDILAEIDQYLVALGRRHDELRDRHGRGQQPAVIADHVERAPSLKPTL